VNDRVQFRRAVLFVSGFFIIFCERRVAKALSKFLLKLLGHKLGKF
jgi:hypothetical protein